MNKILSGVALAGSIALLSAPAMAIPSISGSISINPIGVSVSSGANTVAGASGFTLGSVTTLTGVGAGDLSGFSADVVTVSNPYTFVPSTATPSFLTFSNGGGQTAVFDLASSTVTGRNGTVSGGTVDVFSLGTLHLTGFADTAASFNFAATLSGDSWSASATLQAPPLRIQTTPEPMTLALFGAGLAGIGAIRRRKNSAK